jgi:hypothetical protein
VIGDRCVLDEGARVAAVRLDLKNASPDADFSKQPNGAVFIDLGHLDPSSIRAKHRYRRRRPVCIGSGGLAERVGFEPTVRFPAHTLSKRAP